VSLITQKYFQTYGSTVTVIIPVYDIRQFGFLKISMTKIICSNKSIQILLFFKSKSMSTIESLFVPDLVPELKHPPIFRKFDAPNSKFSTVITFLFFANTVAGHLSLV
jgi:hypothetical protein